MGRDTYYPQTYKTDAGVIEKHYVWASELEKAVHTAGDGTKLTYKHIFDEPIGGSAPGIVTMTKSRVASDPAVKKRLREDRMKRSTNDFKKNVYPTLPRGSTEQKHFAKKHNLS